MTRTFLPFILIGLILAGCTAGGQMTSSPTAPEITAPTETPGVAVPSPPAVELTATTAPSATSVVEGPLTPTSSPTSQPGEGGAWIAFVDTDGNIRLLDHASGETRQVTQDANPLGSGGGAESPVVNYWDLQWSSDGEMLAYRQEVGTPIASGFEYEYNLWVYDLSEGQSRPLLEGQRVFNYVWKPGAHLLAYGLSIPMEYFLDQSAELAVGIWALDVDSGETYLLVEPQRGLALTNPHWAAGGRFLSFEEILYMEGRGQFAYYDFQTQQYVAWDEVIGAYSWSPDGEYLAYDRLSYVPAGDERIWLQDRQRETDAQPLSPQYEDRYAFNPVFSPDGSRLAYQAAFTMPEVTPSTLFVVDVPGGEPQGIGEFENVQDLAWSPDGERLILSSGLREGRAVIEVTVSDPDPQTLTSGGDPAWQPAP